MKFFGYHRRKRYALALVAGVCGISFQIVTFAGRALYPSRDQIAFAPLMGGDARSLPQLFDAKAEGVYLSEKPGIVLWFISRSSTLGSRRREARWFALDSDILLGAVATGDSIAIAGRERVVPISVLPPLRTETILQLASEQEGELAQSYERNHFFGGKTVSGFDWAPIYLSDDLIDTEYGSLLNITDQLLKSWSLRGLIRYVNFNYPNPDSYPFPQPLVEFANTTQVTFNWNTKGAGYSAQSGGYEVFAWNRTGALPIDYLGSSNAELRSAEDIGYDYFAKRNDPNFVRVVQYAQLYQIFRRYHIAEAARRPAFRMGAPEDYRAALLKMLKRVHDIDERGVRASNLTDELINRFLAVKSQVNRLYETGGGEALAELAGAIAAPRLFEKTHRRGGKDAEIEKLVAQCSQNSLLLLEPTGLTRDQAMVAYVRYSQHDTKGWIHTPSIVQSQALGSLSGGVGGHNLDSAITEYRTSSEVAPGEIKIVWENGSKVILNNPADAGRIGETVRTAARNEELSVEQLQTKLRASLNEAHVDDRPMERVLEFSSGREADSARGLGLENVSASITHTGWRTRAGEIADAQKTLLNALTADGSHAIVIERTPNGGYMLIDGPSRRIVKADNEPAAIDALLAYSASGRADGSIRLHLHGFEPRAAASFTKSAEIQLADFGDVPPIRATLDPSELNPQQLKTMLSERYDFREVTIKEVSDPFMTKEGELAIHVEAEVATAKAFEPLQIRFLVALRKGVAMTAEMIQRIKNTIRDAFSRGEIREANDGTLLLTGKIVKDLQRISPDISYVHARLGSREKKDLYIVLNFPDPARAAALG